MSAKNQRPAVCRAEDIRVQFKTGGLTNRTSTYALRGVDVTVERGEIHAIVGESGSGKSTLARVLAGLTDDYEGAVSINGVELHGRRSREQRRSVQMVFQDPYGSFDPRYTIYSSIKEGLHLHRLHQDDTRTYCDSLMSQVELPDYILDSKPSRLSGGQCQRAALARAISLEPELLIADEAVSALDVSVQAEILTLLTQTRDSLGLSILLISHDLGVVRHFADSVTVMSSGEVVESGPVGEVFRSPTHEYTKKLLGAELELHSTFLDSY